MTRHGGRGTVRRPAAAFGYSLTRCSADLDDGSDDEEAGAGQVKRIGAEANRLAHRSPAPAAVATSARWRGWDGREQSGPEIADAACSTPFSTHATGAPPAPRSRIRIRPHQRLRPTSQQIVRNAAWLTTMTDPDR
ncbi:MAG TPA: hypothetical protein VNC63_13640 [Propionibacteriaceae bacterium]|jgi:hypothetical protein|nr:hypothetical protein [Propionibacteriaceae bacterium]